MDAGHDAWIEQTYVDPAELEDPINPEPMWYEVHWTPLHSHRGLVIKAESYIAASSVGFSLNRDIVTEPKSVKMYQVTTTSTLDITTTIF